MGFGHATESWDSLSGYGYYLYKEALKANAEGQDAELSAGDTLVSFSCVMMGGMALGQIHSVLSLRNRYYPARPWNFLGFSTDFSS